jgi:hypothetical protein
LANHAGGRESPIAVSEKYSCCFLVEVSNYEQTDVVLPGYFISITVVPRRTAICSWHAPWDRGGCDYADTQRLTSTP